MDQNTQKVGYIYETWRRFNFLWGWSNSSGIDPLRLIYAQGYIKQQFAAIHWRNGGLNKCISTWNDPDHKVYSFVLCVSISRHQCYRNSGKHVYN